MKFNRYKRFTSFENALVLIFILLIWITLFTYYKKYEEVVKNRVSYEQLYQINTAIMIYTVTKGKFPENLRVLVREEMVEKEGSFIKKRYIEGLSLDRDGYPVDPWGRRYKYDKLRGLAYMDDLKLVDNELKTK